MSLPQKERSVKTGTFQCAMKTISTRNLPVLPNASDIDFTREFFFLFEFRRFWEGLVRRAIVMPADDERTLPTNLKRAASLEKKYQGFAFPFGRENVTRVVTDLEVEEELACRLETRTTAWLRAIMGHIHLRGKWRPRTPRWYNAALTHTKWMGNLSSPTLNSNCENRRACFCQTSPGMHVWGVLVPIRTVFFALK